MTTLYNAFRVYLDARLRPLAKREEGVTIVEYAIMLALIAIAVALAAPNVQAAVVAVFGPSYYGNLLSVVLFRERPQYSTTRYICQTV